MDEDRGADLLVAAAGLGLAHRALENSPHPLALRVPERRPRGDVVEAVEVELDTEPAMVALLRLLAAPQELVQLLLIRPDRAVDPLEHWPLLVAPPVGARDGQELERPDPARPLDVRSLAEVAELAVLEERNGGRRLPGGLRLRREVVEDLDLERLATALLDDAGVVERELLADERMVGRDALVHPVLDRLEVVGRQGSRQLEVVIEAVRDRGPDSELGAMEQVEDGLGHDVGRGVTHRIQRVVGAGVEQLVDRAAGRRLEDLVLERDPLPSCSCPCCRFVRHVRHSSRESNDPSSRQDERSSLPRFHPPSRSAARSPSPAFVRFQAAVTGGSGPVRRPLTGWWPDRRVGRTIVLCGRWWATLGSNQ